MFINLNFAVKFRILGIVDKFTLLVFFYRVSAIHNSWSGNHLFT